MNSEDTVLSVLKRLVIEVAPSAVLESDEDLDQPMGDIGIDSLDVMSLLLKVQDEFSVDVPDDVADDLVSIRSIAEYITKSSG